MVPNFQISTHVLPSLAERRRQVSTAAQRPWIRLQPLGKCARGGLGGYACLVLAPRWAQPATRLLETALFCCCCRLQALGFDSAAAVGCPTPSCRLLLLRWLLLRAGGGCAQLLQLRMGASAAQGGSRCVAGCVQLFWACAEGICVHGARRGDAFNMLAGCYNPRSVLSNRVGMMGQQHRPATTLCW